MEPPKRQYAQITEEEYSSINPPCGESYKGIELTKFWVVPSESNIESRVTFKSDTGRWKTLYVLKDKDEST